MKFEMFFLPSLFATCLLISGLVLGSMLHAPSLATQLAGAAPAACAAGQAACDKQS